MMKEKPIYYIKDLKGLKILKLYLLVVLMLKQLISMGLTLLFGIGDMDVE